MDHHSKLRCADSAENQRKAWCSMAEAAKDCGLFERAVEFYKQARAKEVELGLSANQVREIYNYLEFKNTVGRDGHRHCNYISRD